jgi:hypothetical protein
MAGASGPGMSPPKSRMSIPEQNPRPAPLSTTTRAVWSAAMAAHASRRAAASTASIALRRSGRSRRRSTTPGSGRSMDSGVVDIRSLPSECGVVSRLELEPRRSSRRSLSSFLCNKQISTSILDFGSNDDPECTARSSPGGLKHSGARWLSGRHHALADRYRTYPQTDIKRIRKASSNAIEERQLPARLRRSRHTILA